MTQPPILDEEQHSPPPIFARLGLYLPLVFFAGLALAVLLYAQGMFQLGWSVDTREDPVESPLLAAFVAPDAPEVLLYRSPTAAKFLASVGGSLDLPLRQWRRFFEKSGRSFRETDSLLELDKVNKAVVILPMAMALDERERASLRALQQRGGALLATGPVGVRDVAGDWRGWSFIQSLFEVQVTEEVSADSDERYLVTAGDGVLTHELAAGRRIWLGAATESVLRFQGGHPAAWLMDWARTPAGQNPSVVYGDRDGARWALFGFSENAWDNQPTALYTIVGTTLDWLQASSGAYIANWPSARRAAYLVEMDSEQGFENTAFFGRMLDNQAIRGGFYALTSLLHQSETAADTLQQLARGHEIGYHGDVHQGFEGQPRADQLKRLETMIAQLHEVYPGRLTTPGFRAPTESYDETTEELLIELGIDHHVADPNRSEARLPLLAGGEDRSPEESLVVLPRTLRDDINMLHDKMDAVAMGEMLLADLIATEQQGALGVLSVHSQHFGPEGPLHGAMPRFLEQLAEHREQTWVATGSEIARWWRQHANLRSRLVRHGPRQELEISYYGKEPVRKAAIILTHPFPSEASLAGTRAFIPQGRVRRLDAYRSAVVFEEIEPGNYAYQVTFDK